MNPIVSEALFSAKYVDNYMDSVENLPDDIQRQLSRIRDIDVRYRGFLREVDHYYDLWKSLEGGGEASQSRRARALTRMQHSLIQAQELSDEKMQIVSLMQEIIDGKTRMLDMDQKNLDIKEEPQAEYGSNHHVGQSTLAQQKAPRSQTPSVYDELGVGNELASGIAKEAHGAAYAAYGASGSSVSASNGNALVQERMLSNGSGVAVQGALSHAAAQAAGLVAGAAGGADTQRANKRTRRRNEPAVSNIDYCGSESNSAAEVGNFGGAEAKLLGASGSGLGQKQFGAAAGSSNSGVGGNNNTAGGMAGKKKKRKARSGTQAANAQSVRDETPPPDPIDPDEPTYCLCDQISFGEMILCDNDLCPIEWFHFSCVSLVLKPKGKWYCPNCRGDRPNIMKPKAQFLKELERYNKEKEEKT